MQEFHERWNRIIDTKDNDRVIRAMEFAKSLPRPVLRHLLFHLPALFRKGETNLVINVYEELGMNAVAAYYRSKELELGINAANNGAALYIYHMTRGHRAHAMNCLLIAARKARPAERVLLLRKIVSRLDDSNWGKYYKEKVRRELLASEETTKNDFTCQK